MSDRLLYLGLIVGLLVAAGLIGKTTYDYERFRSLNEEGRIATATIDDIGLWVHNRRGPNGRWLIRYNFRTPAHEVVNGSVGVSREVAAQYHVGQNIDVVYVPDEPSLSAFNSEQAWAVVLYDERVLVPYMALLLVFAWNALERYRSGSA
ncbi:MAG: DUF3592 domain-containing protein [Hyphomicrobium sp.]